MTKHFKHFTNTLTICKLREGHGRDDHRYIWHHSIIQTFDGLFSLHFTAV